MRLFSSASRRKEEFRPRNKKEAKMYVCGVTPYDTTHLGHAFTYVSFDVLVRYLKSKGIEVNYTQNVTDIDDDVLRKAKEEGRDWKELGTFWTNRYLQDMKDINVLRPTNFVKATDSIPQIIKIIEKLMKDTVAYKGGRNVYFDVKKFPRYGNLSHFNAKQMTLLLKERGGNPQDPNKKNPLDFILWQGWKKGEPYWNAPWGKGRPGWHIECSAMISQYLGEQIDLHGGGRDLIFPHHESEIAQSESYSAKVPFVGCFMHSAMVMMAGEKMSKSLGNLVLISDLVKKYSPNAIRWMLLSHHYRQVWEFTMPELDEAQSQSDAIAKLLRRPKGSKKTLNNKLISMFEEIMDDDLDAPKAIAFAKEIARSKKDSATLSYILGILGFSL